MNGDYFQNPTFPNNSTPINIDIPSKEEYLEDNTLYNIIKSNKGKRVNIYVSFPNSDKEFSGILENIIKDHLIISDPETGKWYLIDTKYLNYIEFIEKINYSTT